MLYYLPLIGLFSVLQNQYPHFLSHKELSEYLVPVVAAYM